MHMSISRAETVGNVSSRQKLGKIMYLLARSRGLKNRNQEICFYMKM